jgi:hypothetical protein
MGYYINNTPPRTDDHHIMIDGVPHDTRVDESQYESIKQQLNKLPVMSPVLVELIRHVMQHDASDKNTPASENTTDV